MIKNLERSLGPRILSKRPKKFFLPFVYYFVVSLHKVSNDFYHHFLTFR